MIVASMQNPSAESGLAVEFLSGYFFVVPYSILAAVSGCAKRKSERF
jgi:hypothetical protein